MDAARKECQGWVVTGYSRGRASSARTLPRAPPRANLPAPMPPLVYLGLGANLGDRATALEPQAHLRQP